MAKLLYPSLQQPVPVSDDTRNEARWWKQWVDPYSNINARQSAISRQASGEVRDPYPLGTPEVIGPDRWLQPFSERLHPKRGTPAYMQRELFYSESAQFPETTSIDRYLYPFSLPVWHKPRLIAADNPATFSEEHPEDQDFMGWYQPLSEPKRFPRELNKSAVPTLTTGAHALGTPYARGYVIC